MTTSGPRPDVNTLTTRDDVPTYYNEIDPYAAQWLRNLISEGLIPAGDVDERSIVDVRPADLAGYGQCHFFAGLGGWAHALRLAHVPDNEPIWTGSCPCQPFSVAGKRRGFDDDRHLWPEWFRLIRERRPAIVFGEQVASKDGLGWIDTVSADLEGEAYAFGAADLCAAGVGAPHIRQRLWFMAYADGGDTSAEGLQRGGEYGQQPQDRGAVRVAHGVGTGLEVERIESAWCECAAAERGGEAGELGDAARHQQRQSRFSEAGIGRTGSPGRSGAWGDCEWLPCTDGKARPVEPGTFPLAHGIPARVAKLRALGNAIVPQVAAEFIRSALTT